uniref:Uncharacterized protein n=1 Tax=Cucumis melo TaxID=3656 RepID=A0A9I9EJU6_CUCME
MMMMPTFGVGYCDSEADTGYYDSRIGPSSSYMDVDLSTSYMHGHDVTVENIMNICTMKHLQQAYNEKYKKCPVNQ